ncbi:MAG: AAA family ATPase, partial [Alphaproteobacteria bacterium]|nr:AAA family ATPase [Alphaproteobacteria bacterium]
MAGEINPEKMRDLLVFYRKSFVKHWDDEKYKWQAVKHFQDNWDINAEDFGKMFETATEKTSNLLAAANFFPRGMIINFSKENQEKTRQMFVSLFDEDKDLISRYENFKQAAKELQEEHNATHKDQWNANYQKDNAISTYLWLRYPDKYYIYKYSEYRNVAAVLDSNIKFTKGEKGNITNGFALYNQLCEYLKSDDNIKTLLRDRVDESCYTDSELKTLTIDFGFHISRYYNANLNSFVEEGAAKMSKADELANLLEHTHNLILHGAPGTGKTHLARDIAKSMGCSDNEIGFVQFHPSYDYTDFVEGLRPVNDGTSGQIAFERKDGVFKKFCERALKESKIDNTDNFSEIWDILINELNEKNFIDVPLLSGKDTMRVELNEYGDGLANRTYENNDYVKGNWIRGQSKFFTKEQCYNIYKGLPGIPSGGHDNYRKAIVKYMKDKMGLIEYKEGTVTANVKPFIFIIDEINRGEMSKIFGELFFSIDPGYRGEDGLIQTQYQNLISDGDAFADGFYVPENVYIIGTMNDIDRNVESMDFAFRRRFTFKEIKATDTQQDILAGLDDSIREDAIRRMNSLNDAISNIEGLSSAYHIGGAYFLKLKELDNDFEKLWEYHLEGLLREYLRGM